MMISSPSTRFVTSILTLVKEFYVNNPQINTSHGIQHVLKVHHHSVKAIEAQEPPLTSEQSMEVQSAALLHDVDDSKYFPNHKNSKYNAREILNRAQVPIHSQRSILQMIEWVSASQNGNSVPLAILGQAPTESNCPEEYFRLIPRWSDRLEAVGVRGILRCYQFAKEHGHPLFSGATPRPTSKAEVWKLADPQRFLEYQNGENQSSDMMSHYYDKLLHVARPPRSVVRNAYLESAALDSAEPIVERCLQFGKTGTVDEGFFKELEAHMDAHDGALLHDNV